MQRLFYFFLGIIFLSSCSDSDTETYEIEINSNRTRGHQVRISDSSDVDSVHYIKTVIIGGGAAGVSAYSYLGGQEVALIEMNPFLGGTAAGGNFKTTRFANGAHYDLIYPTNYGEKGLSLLEKAQVIKLDEFNKRYHFIDKQFLIDPSKEATCWRNGEIYNSPLDGFDELPNFKELLMPFANKMVMPTSQIHDSLWYLNEISFNKWLEEEYTFSDEFLSAVSYQMRDDWGGDVTEVSALAGIHYYMCRPYYEEEVELLSPPEGNLYFIEKLLSLTNYEQIYTNNLCYKIERNGENWSIFTKDFEKNIIREFICDEVIYAGNKHALKYIATEIMHQKVPEYSAWISVNLLLKVGDKTGAFWQNDVIGLNDNFMGFSNSYAQFDFTEDHQVLTAYFCYSPQKREDLVDVENNVQPFVDSTIIYLEKVLDTKLLHRIEKVNVNFLGHAMPLPEPKYLIKDYNVSRKYPNFVFAGVDTGRLPLFFEAMESGIEAVDALKNESISKQL